MKLRKDLNWKSSVSDNAKDWATVTPDSGSGDNINIKINIENEKGWADPDTLSGTVTFSCINCESVEEKEKTIDICRCACSCCDLSVEPSVDRISETGLDVETTIGTYALTPRCEKDKISGTIVEKISGTIYELKFGDRQIKLLNAIQYNPQETYTVNVFFDKDNLLENGKCESIVCADGRNACNACKTWDITPEQVVCNCDTAVKDKIIYVPYFNGTTKIPQSGLTAEETLFTYNIKTFCDDKLLTAKVTYEGLETPIEIEIGEGKGTLLSNIEPNEDSDEREITLKIYYDGEECDYNTRTAKQIGCTCSSVFPDDGEQKINISIPTFNEEYENECEEGETCIAVKVGDEIGSYTVKSGTHCPSNKISAKLESGGVEYPLLCSDDGKVYLAGTENILENDSKDYKTFKVYLYYNSEEPCYTGETIQNGVAGNCGDVIISEFNEISSAGEEVGFVLGEYSLRNTECSDINDCMKIEQTKGPNVGVKLEGGNIITTTKIYENGGPLPIDFVFKVLYKINKRWRKCRDFPTIQNGSECSCDSISISLSSEKTVFPYAGTDGEWVTFASGDTGFYKNKGTSEQEFVGVCGKLSAVTESEYLIRDYDPEVDDRVSNPGDYIRIIGVKLTGEEEEIIIRNQGEEYAVPHIYYFMANIKKIENESTDILSVVPVLYFYKLIDGEWIVQNCGARCFFYISGTACDCNKKPNLTLLWYANPISCDGTEGIKKLGYIYKPENVNIEDWYYMKAELLDSVDNQITDFDYYYDETTGSLSVSGNVSQNIPGGPDRTVGIIRVTYICNKGLSNEWKCGELDFEIRQDKCPGCDCAYIKNYCTITELTFPHQLDSAELPITDFFTMDCGDLYIEGQNPETGIYTGEWFEAQIKKGIYGSYYYYYIEISLLEAGSHDFREATIKIHTMIEDDECDSFDLTIKDEKCDCNALEDIEWNMETGETLTINAGVSGGVKTIRTIKIDSCIELFIEGENEETGIYEDPDGYFTAFIQRQYEGIGYIEVRLLKNLNEPKVIIIRGKYYDYLNENWEKCDQQYKLTIIQNICTCPDFKRKVNFLATSFTQHDIYLHIARIANGCGKGILYINYNGRAYCVASDLISDAHEHEDYSMDFIENINECIDGTNCCDNEFSIKVKPLGEGESREMNIAICWCNDDGTIYEDDEGNYCCVTETITQSNWSSCSDLTCDIYKVGLPALTEVSLAPGCELTKIAEYNEIPENYKDCFELSIDCRDARVSEFKHENGLIKMALNNDVTGQVSVDINSTHKKNDGSYESCQYCQIVVTIENNT